MGGRPRGHALQPRAVILVFCLIASTAIRAGVPILHNDSDFDVLARHTELRIYGS